jgi:hypothetical protein
VGEKLSSECSSPGGAVCEVLRKERAGERSGGVVFVGLAARVGGRVNSYSKGLQVAGKRMKNEMR